jgi:3-oxoacyl-[acyl-carrier-protein] synthase-3
MAIGIIGTGSYLPPRVCTNEELARLVDTSDEWIVARTGIRQRRYVDPGVATSDLATVAAEKALRDAGVAASDVGAIVLATSSPDWIQPATACAVHRHLGVGRVPAFDVSAVCAGFVYALTVGSSMLTAEPSYGPMLVIGAETFSKLLDFEDRTTCIFFGDGAGAVLLGEVPEGFGILSTHLLADGGLTDVVGVPAGGTRRVTSPDTIADRDHYFRMDGRRVWDFAVEALPSVVSGALDRAGLSVGDVDLFVFHQANAVMIGACMRALGVDDTRVHLTVEQYANTAAASVPITLDDARAAQRVKHGDVVVLASVGGGMTAGAVALRWYEDND